MRPARIVLFALACALGTGCQGPGHVEFVSGQCVIDGRAATRPEVETRQARISERILARQPLFVLITVLIVALAGFSHIEKLFSRSRRARRRRCTGSPSGCASGSSVIARIRCATSRWSSPRCCYSASPAASTSISTRTSAPPSARSGCSQFCHLALRNNESQQILEEQRRNLETIESTAGNIQTLVDKLPPTEQRKAKEIVAQINAVMAQQGKLVSDYAERTDESSRAVRAETANLQKGLSSLGAELIGLKSLTGERPELERSAARGRRARSASASPSPMAGSTRSRRSSSCWPRGPSRKCAPPAPLARAPMKEAPPTAKTEPALPEVARDGK